MQSVKVNFGASVLYNTCQSVERCLPPISVAQPATKAIALVAKAAFDPHPRARAGKGGAPLRRVAGVALCILGVFLLASAKRE